MYIVYTELYMHTIRLRHEIVYAASLRSKGGLVNCVSITKGPRYVTKYVTRYVTKYVTRYVTKYVTRYVTNSFSVFAHHYYWLLTNTVSQYCVMIEHSITPLHCMNIITCWPLGTPERRRCDRMPAAHSLRCSIVRRSMMTWRASRSRRTFLGSCRFSPLLVDRSVTTR